MVITRSNNGESSKRRKDEQTTQGATEEASGGDSAASGSTNTTSETTTVSDTTATSATDRTTATEETQQEGDQRSQCTLKPGETRSRRSVASRKRLLAELEAKERLAELKLEQAQLQARTELQEIRVQRLQAEAGSTDEDEEIEDDLASVRISTWLQEKPTPQPAPQPAPKPAPQPAPQPTSYFAPQPALQIAPPVLQQCAPQYAPQHTAPQKEDYGQAQQQIDVATLAAALSQAVRSTREPPKYIQELPSFNGSSKEWLSFKTMYEESSKYFTANENIARIRRSLKGTAKEAAGCLLISQPDPRIIIEALERRFGRPEALIHLEIEKLKLLNKVTDNPRELCIFANRIANVVGTVEALKKAHYLHSPEMTRVITDKLTPILKSKWYDYAARKKEDIPELKKISMFLNEEADKCSAYALPEFIAEDSETRERRPRKIERAFATSKKPYEERCPQCKQEHKLPDCKSYAALSTNDRWEVAKKYNICYRCLRGKHRRLLCKAPPCGKGGCMMKHHKLLHHDRTAVMEKEPAMETATSAKEVNTATRPYKHRRAYLKIAPVTIRGPLSCVETYALLDEGSTVTLVDASIADVIGADGPAHTMWIQGVGSEVKHEKSKIVSFKIRGTYAQEEHNIEAARTVERLDFAPESVNEDHLGNCPHLLDIKEDITYERASPKVLIGQDNWHLIVSRKLRVGRRDQPVASYTNLGWVLHGCHSSLTSTVTFCGRLHQREDAPPIEEEIKNYFKLESLCIEPRRPKEDPEQRAMQILDETSQRSADGRFETGLLWKQKDFQIPNNYKEAERRLHTLEKRLDRDSNLKLQYEERIENLFNSGYAERAPMPPPQGRTWYLPHFPVINPAKPNKPPRLVHDAAAKTAGICLNDMLHSGSDLLQSLPGVIMRFRQYPYAVSADIKEMFMQIKVRKEDTTKKNEWRWLPSKENVADDATRATPEGFDESHRWFRGPPFLQRPPAEWPQEEKTTQYDTGEKREICKIAVKSEDSTTTHLPQIGRFSKWIRLIRATARVLLFIDMCRPNKHVVKAGRKRNKARQGSDPGWQRTNKRNTPAKEKKATPTASSLVGIPAAYHMRAEQLWVQASQRESFTKELKRITSGSVPGGDDKLGHLSTYIDEEGTLRLRGRIKAASEVEDDMYDPPILDGKHAYTRLYIAHVHERLHHGGVETVVNELRQRLYVRKIRPVVKTVVKGCLPCRLRKAKPASPSTGNLPSARLAHHARPFTYTGLDYFGPIEVTVGRHREKRYGALFTCMTSRAIHIEVAHSLSADSAVSALRRFMSRRGCPKEIWSDNATCFKAADKEMAEAALAALEHETTCQQIVWKYIPPSAPFMGGVWERMVRSVKEALRVTLNERYPSDETLGTLLAEVENTVNSRPLTHVSVDPGDPEAITPNHILIGPNSHVPAPGHFSKNDVTARQQWKRAQALADVFWRRWVKEYLPLLQHRREPSSVGVSPKIGDLVIICDSNLPRNTWPRGKISKVYPGVDGEVRVVDVTTGSGHILRRPTKKIVVLPEGSQRGDGGRMCTTQQY
ncbi:unnamed protein product [Parnassius mnemosyne]|uniref:Integrase catalytic domain-containing protein n=1 Tax=Parnassius mnemosyne TaxID=213953 RepID=A0AAV1LRB7_9NEOP